MVEWMNKYFNVWRNEFMTNRWIKSLQHQLANKSVFRGMNVYYISKLKIQNECSWMYMSVEDEKKIEEWLKT